jgi:Zn finger protein HypA/HybF involved in hydrogenase expression
MNKIKNRITDENFIAVCESSTSMAQAAATLKIHFNSFKKRAKELNCYNTNQSGSGTHKRSGRLIPIEEIIFEGKHPEYQTFKLKNRLVKEGYKKNECEECGQTDVWNNEKLEMELDHIDGNRTNHLLKNLKMLCPNCHSQTKTFCGKNKT